MRLLRYLIHNRLSIFWFLSVGAMSAIVNILSFIYCWHVLKLSYSFAASIAFILSIVFHFTGNKHITFKHHHSETNKQIPRYITMVFVNYIITLIVMRIAVESIHLSPYVGNVAAIGTTVIVSYILSRYWVFKSKGEII